MSHKLNIKKGDRFNSLTYIEDYTPVITPGGNKVRTARCICDCGTEKVVKVPYLVRDRIKSCGCIYRTKNGESRSPIGIVWRRMIQRCSGSATNHEKIHYFNRGIRVCPEWEDSWIAFKEWAIASGYKKGLQIDRIDNEKGYSPDNCRWATPKENTNNRRVTVMVTYKGITQSLCMLAEKKGMTHQLHILRRRLKLGWAHEDVFDIPIKKR